MRVQVVDPSAFTPPYDHALCAALAARGADVELVTSAFAYGATPAPDGYERRELFYRRVPGAAGSALRRAGKLASHVPDMLRLRAHARDADVVHFQWLDVQWLDARLLPARPVVLTAHDLLPREARPGQARAQRRCYDAVDAIVVHSRYGARELVERLGVPAARVHVINHGAFEHLTRLPAAPLHEPLQSVEGPVALFFGLLRPYKGIATLLEAWRGVAGAELWIVGRPRMALEPLRARAPDSVRFVPEFVPDSALPAYFRRADVVVLPYSASARFDQSGVLATALAFGKPTILTDIGAFSELGELGAARVVAPDRPAELRDAIMELFGDAGERERLAAAAAGAARGLYSWDRAARDTLALYATLSGHNPPP